MPWGGWGGDCGCYLPGGTWGSLAGVPFRSGGPSPEAREGGKDSLLSSSSVIRTVGRCPEVYFMTLNFYLWASILANEGNDSSH